MADRAGDSARDAGAYWDGVIAGSRPAGPNLWRRHADAVNARWLTPRLPKRVEHVLKTDLYDEAVGAGMYDLLAARCARLSGVDVSAEVVARARRCYPRLEAHVADVRRLPFASECFDVVVSNSTLDHFPARGEIFEGLRELARVLRPGGELLLTLDNLANPVIATRNSLPLRPLLRMGLVPYYVGATCGPRGLRRLARAAGLEAREMTAVLHCPRMPAIAFCRLLERSGEKIRRGWLRLLAQCEVLEHLPTRYLTGYYLAMRAVKSVPGGREGTALRHHTCGASATDA